MASDDDPRPDGPQLSAARARLCALLPQRSEREGEALLGIAEVFVKRPDVQSATGAPAPHVRAAASDVPSPVAASASPGAATMVPTRPTYTVPETAQLRGTKESALRERIRVGRVPVLRLGRRVLDRSSTVEHLLAEGSAGHAADGRHALLLAPHRGKPEGPVAGTRRGRPRGSASRRGHVERFLPCATATEERR